MGPAVPCCHLVAPRSNAGYWAERGGGGKMGKVGIKEKEEDRERPEGRREGAEEDRRRESEVEGQKEPEAHSKGEVLPRAQAGQSNSPRTFVCSLQKAPRGHRDPPAHGSEP